MRRLTVIVLLLGACSGKEETTPDPTDTNPVTQTFPDESADTATGPGPQEDYTGMAGSVVIAHIGADPYNEQDSYFAGGLFVDDDADIDNLAACLLAYGHCIDEYPALGDPGVEDIGNFYIYNLYDVGLVDVGSTSLVPYSSGGAPVYYGNPTSLGGPGGITLDGDFAPYAGTDDYIVPDELELTSPDATVAIAAVPGGAIDLAWTSPGAGAVYLEVISFSEPNTPDTIVRLDDDGSHQVLIDDLQFRQPFDSKLLLLSRIETSEVDAAGNTIQVQVRSDQPIYVDFTDTTGWTELPPVTGLGESCSDALLLPAIGAGQYYGDLSTFSHDHDIGDYNPITGYSSLGLDGVVPVTMLAGQTLTATYLQQWDASIYLVGADCDTDNALAGADATLDGQEEEVVWTAPSDGTWYLVLDAWTEDQGAPFSLVLDIQ